MPFFGLFLSIPKSGKSQANIFFLNTDLFFAKFNLNGFKKTRLGWLFFIFFFCGNTKNKSFVRFARDPNEY